MTTETEPHRVTTDKDDKIKEIRKNNESIRYLQAGMTLRRQSASRHQDGLQKQARVC